MKHVNVRPSSIRKVMGLEIRRAVEEDSAAIATVLHEAFVEYESLYTPGGFAATTPSADTIRERFSEGPVWVAAQDGAIVGTVAVVLRGEGLYVRSMAVLPDARGQKVGELLLRVVEGYALEVGAAYMYLSTTPFLDRAIRLYERFGFSRPDERVGDLHGTPLFEMVKKLSRREA